MRLRSSQRGSKNKKVRVRSQRAEKERMLQRRSNGLLPGRMLRELRRMRLGQCALDLTTWKKVVTSKKVLRIGRG